MWLPSFRQTNHCYDVNINTYHSFLINLQYCLKLVSHSCDKILVSFSRFLTLNLHATLDFITHVFSPAAVILTPSLISKPKATCMLDLSSFMLFSISLGNRSLDPANSTFTAVEASRPCFNLGNLPAATLVSSNIRETSAFFWYSSPNLLLGFLVLNDISYCGGEFLLPCTLFLTARSVTVNVGPVGLKIKYKIAKVMPTMAIMETMIRAIVSKRREEQQQQEQRLFFALGGLRNFSAIRAFSRGGTR